MAHPTASEESIPITINGQTVAVAPGLTVLQAARQLGLSIPTLCALPSLPAVEACRLCVVEIKGEARLQPACAYPLTAGVSVSTHSPAVLASRRMTMELLLARCLHNREPYTGDEGFQQLVHELGIRHSRFSASVPAASLDNSSPAVRYNPNACIQCGLCVAACGDMQQSYAINFEGRSIQQRVQPGLERSLGETECTACGQCTVVCPTGAFVEQDQVVEVITALADPSKVVIAMVSPAVGPAIGPEFGMPDGREVTGKLVHGLKQVGFDLVFSTGIGHDLVALETAFELARRLETGERLPLIFSSCPALVKQMEHQHPDLLPYLSVNRSPAQMFGHLLKTYYAERLARNPADVVVVQITPCLSSKYERQRQELEGVDLAVTSREVVRLLRSASGYALSSLPEMPFDAPFNQVSGAGILSEVTGGTMEAALRTFYELKTGAELHQVEFEEIRRPDALREAVIAVGDDRLHVAVACDLGHGNTLLDRIRDGKAPYHLIEIMACPGGCAGGGGQPEFGAPETVRRIAAPLYQADRESAVRKPRKNPVVNRLYAEFLKRPFGEKCHELLQTVYTERGRYGEIVKE
jgi:NADH-quinone oxidoreductase subunit G/NADP-reducing hydrogenase subunit HndD